MGTLSPVSESEVLSECCVLRWEHWNAAVIDAQLFVILIEVLWCNFCTCSRSTAHTNPRRYRVTWACMGLKNTALFSVSWRQNFLIRFIHVPVTAFPILFSSYLTTKENFPPVLVLKLGNLNSGYENYTTAPEHSASVRGQQKEARMLYHPPTLMCNLLLLH